MKTKDITAATAAFIQAWRKDVVPAEVIAERARVCKGCKIKRQTFAAGILKTIIDKNGVPKELGDYACGICKCPLLNLIVAKEVHQDSEKERARRSHPTKGNPNCWMLKL